MRRGPRRVAAACVAASALVAGTAAPPAGAVPVPGTDRTYTTDSQFDQGALVDVHHDAPQHDQLQLSRVSTPFPFVNVAASQRGTMVRINVDTGQITGEYLTAPAGRGRNPSRTTVDRLGNVWVANRDEAGGGRGSVTRIGLVQGGQRANADGTLNPAGAYLKPPFGYSTCEDRDGDGLIKTSSGLGDIRPWTNVGAVDSNGGVATADDECTIDYARVAGQNTRTVAVDANNDVWTGGADTEHELVDGVTGQPVAGTQFDLGCGGYGGLIDSAGTLWSARFGAGLLRYEPSSASGACLGFGRGDYGLGLDPTTGQIWHTFLSGNRVAKLAPDGALIAAYPHGNNAAQGVAVDREGNVWVAHSLFGATTVGHLRTDGTYVGNVALPGGQSPTGVAVDSNGKVWVTNFATHNAQRIDPDAGPIGGGGFPVGAVDLTVNLGPGAGPYNYSDMTGSVLGVITAPQGTWNVVQDGGDPSTTWGRVTWNTEPEGSQPAGTDITVEVRVADTLADLAGASFDPVANGAAFSKTGRFIEVRAALLAGPDGTSPVLSDLRVEVLNQPPDCSAAAPSIEEIWPPNHKFVPVEVVGVEDPDGDAVTITVDGIRQDEPTDTFGDGRFAPDGRGVGTPVAGVRAERAGTKKVPGDGRVYHIAYTASDGNGGSCSGVVRVGVPHDQDGDPPVDGGPLHDSTV